MFKAYKIVNVLEPIFFQRISLSDAHFNMTSFWGYYYDDHCDTEWNHEKHVNVQERFFSYYLQKNIPRQFCIHSVSNIPLKKQSFAFIQELDASVSDRFA